MIGEVMAVVAVLGSGAAPPAQDGSWLAWHGCWRVTGEVPAAGDLMCVLPGADAAEVRLVALSGGAIVHESRVRADGVARPVDEGGCAGTETARWSRDGRRVFLTADLRCDGLERRTSGVMALVAENEWVDVQSYSAAGADASRTIRYRAVPAAEVPAQYALVLADGRDLARETARTAASAPLDLDEVIEATSALSPSAVQALLGARRHGFGLNAAKLIRLADAGVPPATIDVMVALSYPATFTVHEPGSRAVAAGHGVGGGYGYDARTDREVCDDPFVPRAERETACRAEALRYGRGRSYGWSNFDRYYDPFYYSRYGVNYNTYSPYGWNYGGRPIIIVRPQEERRQSGSLVKGGGYTTGSPSSRTATARRSGEGGSSGSAGSSSSGSSTSSGSSSTGSSSSGSTSSGRTAIPRGSGGGGGGGGSENMESR